MPPLEKILVIASAGISGFALLLLIIGIATPVWIDSGTGYTVGIFRSCGPISGSTDTTCVGASRAPQAGLSVFGLLLLSFSIIAAVASLFLFNYIVVLSALGLLYFSSIFIMSAYSTWAVYLLSDPPFKNVPLSGQLSIGYSYNLCVASHYFIWTSLTIFAFAVGYKMSMVRNEQGGGT